MTLDGKMGVVTNPEPRPDAVHASKKLRHVRVESGVWVAACEKATREGVTISEVVRQLLDEYLERGSTVTEKA